MSADQLLTITREGLWLALLLALPPVLAAVLVGFVTSFLQAVTTIRDPVLSFAPKLIAVVAALVAAGPWIVAQYVRFTTALWVGIASVGGG